MNGYSDGTFKPGALIRADELVKILLSALGNRLSLQRAKYLKSKGLELGKWYEVDRGIYDGFHRWFSQIPGPLAELCIRDIVLFAVRKHQGDG